MKASIAQNWLRINLKSTQNLRSPEIREKLLAIDSKSDQNWQEIGLKSTCTQCYFNSKSTWSQLEINSK